MNNFILILLQTSMSGGERSKRRPGGEEGSSSRSTPSRRYEEVRNSSNVELRNELAQIRDALSTEKRLVLRLVSDKERLTNKLIEMERKVEEQAEIIARQKSDIVKLSARNEIGDTNQWQANDLIQVLREKLEEEKKEAERKVKDSDLREKVM